MIRYLNETGIEKELLFEVEYKSEGIAEALNRE
jgi:hypothetical protein